MHITWTGGVHNTLRCSINRWTGGQNAPELPRSIFDGHHQRKLPRLWSNSFCIALTATRNGPFNGNEIWLTCTRFVVIWRSCLAQPRGITLFWRPAQDTRFPQTALLPSQLRKQSLRLHAHVSQISRAAWKYDSNFSRPSKDIWIVQTSRSMVITPIIFYRPTPCNQTNLVLKKKIVLYLTIILLISGLVECLSHLVEPLHVRGSLSVYICVTHGWMELIPPWLDYPI